MATKMSFYDVINSFSKSALGEHFGFETIVAVLARLGNTKIGVPEAFFILPIYFRFLPSFGFLELLLVIVILLRYFKGDLVFELFVMICFHLLLPLFLVLPFLPLVVSVFLDLLFQFLLFQSLDPLVAHFAILDLLLQVLLQFAPLILLYFVQLFFALVLVLDLVTNDLVFSSLVLDGTEFLALLPLSSVAPTFVHLLLVPVPPEVQLLLLVLDEVPVEGLTLLRVLSFLHVLVPNPLLLYLLLQFLLVVVSFLVLEVLELFLPIVNKTILTSSCLCSSSYFL